MARDTDRSDTELVRAVLDGEREAYRHLVRRYQDLLYRHALRMTGDSDVAEDMVQEALVKGYRSLDQCRQPERVGGWLFRIASNKCKDYLKSRRRSDVALEDAPTQESGGSGPGEAARRAGIRDDIQDALERLTPEKREAFLLKHLEGWAYEEMAERLDVSVSALKMRVHRAREELQDLLEEYR